MSDNQAERRARIQPTVAQALLESLDRIEELEDGDRIFLVVDALELRAEHRVLPFGPLENRHFGRAILLAADAVVRAFAGAGTRWFPAIRALSRNYAIWTKDVLDLVDRKLRGDAMSPREEKVIQIWNLFREKYGPPRDMEQFFRAAKRVNRSLELDDGRDDLRQTLQTFRLGTMGTTGGIFRGRDGRILLGPRQLRDGSCKLFGLRRPRGKARCQDGLEAEDVVDREQEDAFEALEELEMLDLLRQWVQNRDSPVKPGSVREVVLRHFVALMRKTKSINDLAKECKRGRSALQRAYAAEREAFLARYPGFAA